MAPILVALLVLAARARYQEPRVVERRFTSELELSTESFEIEAMAEGKRSMQQGPRYTREEAYEVDVADTFLDDEEPPGKFTREYRTVTNSLRLSGAKTPMEKTGNAALEGKRVTFERGENGRWARTCDDEEIRQGQLNRLRVDLSLARFLPGEGEDEGDGEEGEDAAEPASTTLSFADFQRLLAPLEERPHHARKKPADSMGGLDLAPSALIEALPVLMGGAEGELTVTPRARGEDDELPRNADLAFRFEGDFDGSEGVLAAGPGEAEDELEFVYSGTGRLAWDPESGRIQLHCEGEVHLSEHFEVRLEAGDKKGAARGRLALAGTLELEASEEAGD